MNTWIWGPPTWKLLHTLAFRAPSSTATRTTGAECASDIAAFILTLQDVLPCVYCRVSLEHFLRLLHMRFGRTLRDVVADGDFARWMYDLHELVNDKLNKQALVVNVDATTAATNAARRQLQAHRQITFTCLSKRFSICPVAFCARDVWDMLKMFALNIDTQEAKLGTGAGTGTTRASWFLFLSLLPRMVEICFSRHGCEQDGDGDSNGDDTLADALRACHQQCVELHERRQRTPPVSNNIVDTYFFCVVSCWREQGGGGGRGAGASILEQRKLYAKAEAHSCVDGSCK